MGDCELIRDGLLAQPVNTISSLAFVVAAVYVRRRPVPAAALALVGVGSVLFHGAPSTISTIVHDAGVIAVAIVAIGLLWRQRRDLPWAAIAVFAVGGVVYALSKTDQPWCDPTSILQGHALWHVAVAIGVVLLVERDQSDRETS